ncbi:MAG: hypothetical protein M1812_001205 [Candelaria pacifica]|nr:MAG: hypothetical protein M1812_001205 [Candelaria pacifica]
MRSSKPTVSTARPIPRSVQTSPSPQTISPSSPRSPITSYSPLTQSSNNTYFNNQATSAEMSSPPSDRNILGRISSFSKRNGGRSRSKSPVPASPRPLQERSVSDSVTQAPRSVPSSPTQPTSPKRRHRGSGTYTDCGRHGNDWLFGGFSVTGTVKGLFNDSGKN